MAFRSRGFSRGARSLRRKTSWEVGPDSIGGNNTAAASTGASGTLIGTGAQVLVDGLTLIRTRGRIDLNITLVTAALDGFTSIALGVGIMTAEAFAVGPTAAPSPGTDDDWDGWLWHQHVPQMIGPVAGIGANVGTTLLSRSFEVDSKAMRKLNLGDTIFSKIEMVEAGTASMVFRQGMRLLVKLP